MKNLNLTYIAGFLDADGCINAQIVYRVDYKLKFQIRVLISFAQKSNRHWFIEQLHHTIKSGVIRKRKDGMSEYTITGIKNVRPFLYSILPFLIIKKEQAKLLLEIIEDLEKKEPFLKICKKVD